MPGNLRRVYWDSNLFLYYINGDTDRLPVIDALLTDIRRNKDTEICTSTISIVEVAYGHDEQGAAPPDSPTLARIDEMWNDTTILRLVDVHPAIAYHARTLMREMLEHRWKLLGPDAIHLATARAMSVQAFLTYDGGLYRYEPYVGFPIREPFIPQPALPLDPSP